MALKGIDISNWQKSIDLSAIKADFVIIKSSEGIGWTDPAFKDLFKRAKATNKKLGVYHFARPTADNDPVKEAESFVNIIKPEGVIGKALLVLDWEAENQHNTSWAKSWLDRVYALTGVKPMIYMSESVVNAHDWSAVAKAGYELWVAKYWDNELDYNYDMSNAGNKPSIKHWSKYTMWQWTSSGRLDGFNANLDCNEFYGTAADWDKLANASSEKPKETTETTTVAIPGYKTNVIMSPTDWFNRTYGQSYDVDGYYGAQCWDYFAYFVRYTGLGLNTHCALSGYVGDLWDLKDRYGYSAHFDYITNPSQLQNGDWIIWGWGSSCPLSHIAMYWNGQALGQNQDGYRIVNLRSLRFDIAGAFRWKGWNGGGGSPAEKINLSKYSDYELANMVIAGKFGNGDTRKQLLGTRYDGVQNMVNRILAGEVVNKKSNEEVAKEVIQGLWGNGDDRRNKLKAAGYDYDVIQNLVNHMLNSGGSAKKSNSEIAQEVLAGLWGNGDDRRNKLQAAGYNYDTIQALVNELLGIGVPKDSNDKVADQVIAGLWGNGDDRRKRLIAAGYNYDTIQALVNKKLGYSGGSARVGVGSRIRIGNGAKDLNTGALYANFVYNTVYQVMEVSGNRVVFGINGVVVGATALGNVSLA